MNKYLLLRDNKQSGPYTLEELVAKGFKAYDLVWLEGRSAAWRYPSEFPEFKQFAPVIEEQPFDRFYYRKPASNAEAVEQETVTKKENITPVMVEAAPAATVKEAIKPKKIYVTMPAGINRATSFTAAVNGNGKEEFKKYEPLPADVIVEKIEKKEAVKEPVILTDPVSLPVTEENFIALAPRRKRGAGKAVMLFLGAACLILAGIVIGLAISFNRQQSDKGKLESLVKQIQDRENNKNAAEKAPAPQPVINTVVPDSTAINTVDSANAKSPITDEAGVKPEYKQSLRAKKDDGTQAPADNKSIAITASNMNKDTEMKITPAVNTSKDKTTYTQAAIEAARKNIYQMVSVESNKFKVGVLGGVSDLHLTLSNNSNYPLDQVIVEVKYFGPEKKLVKTQSMLFNEVAAGEQKTLEVPRTNRGVTIDYSITQINSRVLGLAQVK